MGDLQYFVQDNGLIHYNLLRSVISKIMVLKYYYFMTLTSAIKKSAVPKMANIVYYQFHCTLL